MDIPKPIIYSGKWWLPSEKQKEVGTLQIINDKEIRLELNYFLNLKPGMQINDDLINFEIILGETDNKEKITLCNCRGDGIFGKLFKIEFVVIGEYFNTLEDVKFKSVEMKYTYLDEWSYPYWYAQSTYTGVKENKTYIKKVKTTYIKKEPIKISLDIPENKLNLTFNFNLTNSHDNVNKKYKERETTLFIESEEQKTFSKWWDIITIIRNFLILGITKPIHPSIISANINKRRKVIIYRAININISLLDLRFSDMLFTLDNIEKDIGIYLKNWFVKSYKLKNIVTGLFIVLNNPEMGYENQLIYLSGLAEWYFRDNKDSSIMDSQEYNNQRIRIIDLIKNNTNLSPCFIENNIINKYGYQKNFRTVLKELVSQAGEVFQLENSFKKYYCNKTIDTRNYFVHKDEQHKNSAAKGIELYYIIKFFEIILVINLLIEIEFDKEILKKIFNRHDEFNEIYRSLQGKVKK
jgi:hypothetical protein